MTYRVCVEWDVKPCSFSSMINCADHWAAGFYFSSACLILTAASSENRRTMSASPNIQLVMVARSSVARAWRLETIIFSWAKPSYCIHSGLLREDFSTISPANMNGSEPNLAGRNYVTKRPFSNYVTFFVNFLTPSPCHILSHVSLPHDKIMSH